MVLWFVSIAVFFVGLFYFKYFYVRKKQYFIPYVIFQLGATLLVTSIFIIGGWSGMFYGMVAGLMMLIGLFVALIIFIFFKIKGSKAAVQ